MRDRINRNMIAEENSNLTGHPATENIERWSTTIIETTDDYAEGNSCPISDSPVARQKKIDQMDEVIKEDIDRL